MVKFLDLKRASAETDLMDGFGLQRVCMWSANSAHTAMTNYALVRKEDYDDSGAQKSYAISDEIQPNPTKNPGVLMGDTGPRRHRKNETDQAVGARGGNPFVAISVEDRRSQRNRNRGRFILETGPVPVLIPDRRRQG